MESTTTNRARPTSKAVEFRRLCHRIATNDPSLTVVSLALIENGGGGAGPTSTQRWSDADAELFARSMASNTVVDRVEVPVVVGSRHRASRTAIEAPSSTADVPSPTRPLRPADSLLSLSASTRVGRALLGVSEVHLVGTRTPRRKVEDGNDGRAGEVLSSSSLSSSLIGDSGDDESRCGLLLHVLLNILGTSKRLWHLRLVDISFGPAAAASLWNLLSRSSSLKALDLVRCGIWPGRDAPPSPPPPSARRLLLDAAAAPVAHSSTAEVPPQAEPASHEEVLAATLTYRAFARNTTVEQLVVDHEASSSHDGSFMFLNAVMSGLLQRQTVQRQKQAAAAAGAPSSTTVSGRGMLRVFQLQLPRMMGDDEALPASLGQFLAATTARDVRVHGGGASSLHRILAACTRSFASPRSDGGASLAAAAPRALQLKGCIVNPGDLAHLCEHVARGSSLTELAVHEMDVGTDGLRGLARALSSPEATLQVLDLFDIHAGTPLNVTDDHVGSAFRDALKSNHTLRVLKLGEVTLGSAAGGGSRLLLETLRHNPTLREVDLFHVHDLDLQLLASSCVSLTRLGLVLCCGGIGPHRLSQFLTALQDHASHLSDLDLSSNRFGNPEAVVISVFVKRSTSLCRLALDNNDITEGGAALMFRSISGHPTIQELSLSGNRLGSPAVRALLESLPALQLRRLALWWDNDDSESSNAARALIQKLASNSSLVGLNLENNLGRAYRPFIDYYLYRNRLCPWLNEHEVDEAMSPVSSSLWPQALERLSRRDASVAYFVMREKLPRWKTCEQIQISR